MKKGMKAGILLIGILVLWSGLGVAAIRVGLKANFVHSPSIGRIERLEHLRHFEGISAMFASLESGLEEAESKDKILDLTIQLRLFLPSIQQQYASSLALFKKYNVNCESFHEPFLSIHSEESMVGILCSEQDLENLSLQSGTDKLLDYFNDYSHIHPKSQNGSYVVKLHGEPFTPKFTKFYNHVIKLMDNVKFNFVLELYPNNDVSHEAILRGYSTILDIKSTEYITIDTEDGKVDHKQDKGRDEEEEKDLLKDLGRQTTQYLTGLNSLDEVIDVLHNFP